MIHVGTVGSNNYYIFMRYKIYSGNLLYYGIRRCIFVSGPPSDSLRRRLHVYRHPSDDVVYRRPDSDDLAKKHLGIFELRGF